MFEFFLFYDLFCFIPFPQPKPIDVNVITHHMQRYAVWFGGSMLASTVSKEGKHLYVVVMLYTSIPLSQYEPGGSHEI